MCIALVMGLTLLGLHAAPLQARDAWSVRVSPYGQVFPALELSQARRRPSASSMEHVLGTGSGLIAVKVRARHANEQVTLRIDLPQLGAPQHFSATLKRADMQYQLHPPLIWSVTRLREFSKPVATQLRITLLRDGADVGTRVVDISLRPLDEALYFVRDGIDSVDLSWVFAAYVDEHDVVVDQIIDRARRTGIVDSFDGYAVAGAHGVQIQVWAVWQTLSEHGIRYSGADPAIERGPHVFSQRVRFLKRTWADRTANCIDGSVLIASVLQRIGLRSFLVLVPGHAFVGYYTDARARHAAYLETTLLGAHMLARTRIPVFAQGLELNDAQRESLASFSAALNAGRARHAHAARKLDGRHRPDYVVIDIDAARRYGIRPINLGQDALSDGTRK